MAGTKDDLTPRAEPRLAPSQSIDTTTGKPVEDKSIGGAASVSDGVSGALKTRRLDAMLTSHQGADVAGANANAIAFSEADDVRKAFVTMQATGAVSTNQDYCDIVLDMPNGVLEKSALEALNAGNLLGEEFITIRVQFGIRTPLPITSNALRRIGFNPTLAARVLVEAY